MRNEGVNKSHSIKHIQSKNNLRRRFKSESDLFNMLQSKNFRYYTDEAMFSSSNNGDDSTTDQASSTG